MSDEELVMALSVPGKRFRVTGHEYKFEGTVQIIFRKRNGNVRCVVENDDGVCLIQSLKNIEEVPPPLPNVPDWKE
jgi:hypothetical protein